MNFNSVRGGIRRHAPFEEKLTEIFSKDILETPFPGINININEVTQIFFPISCLQHY